MKFDSTPKTQETANRAKSILLTSRKNKSVDSKTIYANQREMISAMMKGAVYALVASSALHSVDGHGYLTSPRSRNWLAHEDINSCDQAGGLDCPPPEYCCKCPRLCVSLLRCYNSSSALRTDTHNRNYIFRPLPQQQ